MRQIQLKLVSLKSQYLVYAFGIYVVCDCFLTGSCEFQQVLSRIIQVFSENFFFNKNVESQFSKLTVEMVT